MKLGFSAHLSEVKVAMDTPNTKRGEPFLCKDGRDWVDEQLKELKKMDIPQGYKLDLENPDNPKNTFEPLNEWAKNISTGRRQMSSGNYWQHCMGQERFKLPNPEILEFDVKA